MSTDIAAGPQARQLVVWSNRRSSSKWNWASPNSRTGCNGVVRRTVLPSSGPLPRARRRSSPGLGLRPPASFFACFLKPVRQRLGLPFPLITTINVALIVPCMTYPVASG